MSEKYIPLYRKYRPKNLQEVVGQDHIKKALENAISLDKISHAYLFTGPRGTGKTSIARIFAKSLNCDQGPTLTPCETCSSCFNITNSGQMDVIEIDAASNRKVEEIENNILGKVFQHSEGKYKIYIIDEVHMLTNHAFNALLKTLEEPPEKVIFILATTEPQKVLETIVSRCQRFDFRRITTDDIINYLKNIAKLEKIKIDDDAISTIAKNSAGGMRDSLALLDQVSVLGNSKTITSEDVNKLLGRISFDMLNNLSDSIIQSKPQNTIELLGQIYNSGNEPSQILINLMSYFKNMLIVKNCVCDELLTNLTQLNSSQIQTLKIQSEHIDTHQITFLIEKIIYYIKELKINTNQHLWLEVAMIDLANLAQNTSLLELQERISRLESGEGVAQSAKPVYIAKPTPAVKEEKDEVKQEIVNNRQDEINTDIPIPEPTIETNEFQDIAAKPKKESTNISPSTSSSQDLFKYWHELLQNISSTPTVSLLNQHARPIEISEEKIIIGCKENFLKMLNSDSKKAAIEEGAKKLFGLSMNKSVSVIIKSANSTDFSAIEKKNPIIEKPVKKAAPEAIEKEPIEDISEEDEFADYELSKKKNEKFIPSDQVSMVMTLFDGKYVE